jgi:hypothetical protein
VDRVGDQPPALVGLDALHDELIAASPLVLPDLPRSYIAERAG